ncbi:MAG: hypothetical protein M3142_13845 [Bacteroidota bacterium]|nr:hypothetical protein [Bacteroidota bacterium]
MTINQKTFSYLFTAYAISAIYQYYRFTLHQHPADTFGITEIIGYFLFFGWSALALVEKPWAAKAVLSLCIIQLGIGLFYYFPVIFRYRHDNFWDWAEALLFVLLIALAGVSQLTVFKKEYRY